MTCHSRDENRRRISREYFVSVLIFLCLIGEVGVPELVLVGRLSDLIESYLVASLVVSQVVAGAGVLLLYRIVLLQEEHYQEVKFGCLISLVVKVLFLLELLGTVSVR